MWSADLTALRSRIRPAGGANPAYVLRPPATTTSSTSSADSWLQRSRAWVPAAALIGVMISETVRYGGFWPQDSLIAGAMVLLVLVVQAATGQIPRRVVPAVVGSLALAGWWALRAYEVGTPRHFLPLGPSFIAFAGGLAVVSGLDTAGRRAVASAIVGIGACVAAVGFAGMAERWFPLAMPAQNLWRLSSTLTYSNAAGLLIALSLLVVLGLDEGRWWVRASACLCLGGLLASQSRGAILAAVAGSVLVPWRHYLRKAVPLLLGAVVGVVAIGTSPRVTAVPMVAVATGAACLLTVVWRGGIVDRLSALYGRRGVRWAAFALLVVLVTLAGLFLVRKEIGLRSFAPSDGDRTVTWKAASKQLQSSPLVGVGPDRLVTFHAPDGTFSHFVHNEYLQVAADSGAIGLALLVGTMGLIAVRVRRVDALAACGAAAAVALAVGGAMDFDWHLPAIGLMGGCVAALATSTRETKELG